MRELLSSSLLAFSAVASAVGCSFDGGNGTLADAAVAGPDTGRDDAGNRLDWFDNDYRARIRVDIANPTSAVLADFPVAVAFDGSNMDAFGENGEKIRFADSAHTELPFEIEAMGQQAQAWVKVTLPADGEITAFLYFDFVGSQPASASNGEQTFSAYASVYHFSDSFGGGDLIDNSTAGPDLSAVASTSIADSDVGQFGRALELGIGQTTGATQYAETPNPEFLVDKSEAVVFQGWFNTADMDVGRVLIDNYDGRCSGSANNGVALFMGATDLGGDGILIGEFCGSNNEERLTTSGVFDDGNWHHFALVLDRPNRDFALFVDGVVADEERNSSPLDQDGVSNGPTFLGNGTQLDLPFIGLIDEFRLSDVPTDQTDWFRAEYQNRPGGGLATVAPTAEPY